MATTLHALAELNPSGDKVEVHFAYNADFVRSIKEVPGARFVPKDKGGPFWTVPLNLDYMRRLREEFGDSLVLGRALKQWGKEAVERERNLHTLAASDDVPVKDLVLNTKIPDLAEWLRPYQRADVKFMSATSCLNLNQPGLGKTAEIIAAVFEAGLENGVHLVVAPKTSLETVWRFEIERWTDKLEKPHEVITYHGDLPAGAKEHALEEFWACVEDDWPVWFVCTPDTLRYDKHPKVEEWNTFSIDEYHKTGLPNAGGKSGTKFAAAAAKINAKRRYAVSGTPMGGRPIKLWGALNFLYPKQFTSKWAWAQAWLVVNNNGFGKEIGGIQLGREDEFYRSLAPYAVRRLKAEVLPQLPQKQYIDVWCTMTKNQEKQYNAMYERAELEIEEQSMNAVAVLAQYARLKVFADAYCDSFVERKEKCWKCEGTGKVDNPDAYYTNINSDDGPTVDCQRCGGSGQWVVQKPIPSTDSGKLQALWERLNEIGIDPEDEEGDAQTVIASQFKEVVDMVHRWLNEKGIKAEKITGDTKESERARIQQDFQQGRGPRVVVMTTTAGGVSITLDMADTVHILDETWVPDDQEQLEDRIHRASRMHQVTCYYYRSRGTIEEEIHEANIDKANINREILDLRRNRFREKVRADG